jgi:DNA polymerase I
MTIIIDGNNAANRSFFGYPALHNREGEDIRILVGVLDTIRKSIKCVRDYFPNDEISVVVAWDKGIPGYRYAKYPDYKKKSASKQRKPEIEAERKNLIKLNSLILNEQVFPMINVPFISYSNCEADDIVSVITRQVEDKMLIVSTDTDFYQLLKEDIIYLFEPIKERIIDAKDWELTPSQSLAVKLLSGDDSDSLPGIPGIGPKTALQLIKDYGGIEEIFAYAKFIDEKDKKYKLIQKVIANKDYLSAVYIVINLDFSLSIPGLWEKVYTEMYNFEPIKIDTGKLQKYFLSKGVARILESFRAWIDPLLKISIRKIPLIK